MIKAEKQSEGFTDPFSDRNVTCFANSRAFPSATVAESQYWQSLSFRSKGIFEWKKEFPIETIQTIVGIFRHFISIDGMTTCCRFPGRIGLLEFNTAHNISRGMDRIHAQCNHSVIDKLQRKKFISYQNLISI